MCDCHLAACNGLARGKCLFEDPSDSLLGSAGCRTWPPRLPAVLGPPAPPAVATEGQCKMLHRRSQPWAGNRLSPRPELGQDSAVSEPAALRACFLVLLRLARKRGETSHLWISPEGEVFV